MKQFQAQEPKCVSFIKVERFKRLSWSNASALDMSAVYQRLPFQDRERLSIFLVSSKKYQSEVGILGILMLICVTLIFRLALFFSGLRNLKC
jgi:hypothetical protein